MSISYLDTLPVEILHRIFDNLDAQTICLSFRYVSKRFYSVVNSYNRYHFNFESISKSHFYLICRTIPFEQVISLTLSDEDKTHGQIRLFLSLFNINQFSRLRSLTLIQIEDNDLRIFLIYVMHSPLTFLTINSQTLIIRKNTALDLLSATIEHYTLQKLDLNMWPKDMNELQWPQNGVLTYLRIRNSITPTQFRLILQHSPCLQTIILKDFNMDDIAENTLTYFDHTPFLQLKSLTCEGGRIQMTKLEQCLLLTPALTHLKLIGHGTLSNYSFDGFRWEQLIQTKLSLLKKFQFFITTLTYVNYDTSNIKQIISLFQTPFWLNEQQCFVRCDYIVKLHNIFLYSIPICSQHFTYYSHFNKVSSSNFTIENNDPMLMENVQHLDVCLTKLMNNDSTEKDELSNDLLFRNVTELTLGIDGIWPTGSFRFLSTVVNLFYLVKLSLSINFSQEYMPSIVTSINKLLQRASNVQTLSLFDYWAPQNCTTTMETVCLMITPNIKHLHIRIKNSDDIKFIIENLEDLISISFEYTGNMIFDHGNLIDCLSESRRHSSRWECQYALHVWLDNN